MNDNTPAVIIAKALHASQIRAYRYKNYTLDQEAAYERKRWERKAAEVIKAIEAAGYRIVPLEPTEAMIEAAARALCADWAGPGARPNVYESTKASHKRKALIALRADLTAAPIWGVMVQHI